MEQRNEFLALRDEIIQAVQPLLASDALNIDDRLRLTLRLAQTKREPALYRQVFDLAGKLEDEDRRLSNYLELLDDIELEIEDQLVDVDTSEAQLNDQISSEQDQSPQG